VTIIPDLYWYNQAGREKGITGRCPFATVESCPRYYQSLSLLGEVGSTNIAPHEVARLLAYWHGSDLWPKTSEYATSVSGPAGDPHQFSNFCPEVAFDRFGYFASFLARYADEIDTGVAHTQLSKEHAPGNDWRWSWAAVSPEHYADCSFYSVLAHRSSTGSYSSSHAELPWWRKHLVELIVGLSVTVIGGLLLKLFG
jgi:hypothetical protein